MPMSAFWMKIERDINFCCWWYKILLKLSTLCDEGAVVVSEGPRHMLRSLKVIKISRGIHFWYISCWWSWMKLILLSPSTSSCTPSGTQNYCAIYIFLRFRFPWMVSWGKHYRIQDEDKIFNSDGEWEGNMKFLMLMKRKLLWKIEWRMKNWFWHGKCFKIAQNVEISLKKGAGIAWIIVYSLFSFCLWILSINCSNFVLLHFLLHLSRVGFNNLASEKDSKYFSVMFYGLKLCFVNFEWFIVETETQTGISGVFLIFKNFFCRVENFIHQIDVKLNLKKILTNWFLFFHQFSIHSSKMFLWLPKKNSRHEKKEKMDSKNVNWRNKNHLEIMKCI